MSKVKCCYCGLEFDKDKEGFGHPKDSNDSNKYNIRRYCHSECGEKNNWISIPEFNRLKAKKELQEEMQSAGAKTPQQQKKMKRCLYCGKLMDKDTADALMVGVGTRYAHKECYEKYFNADDRYIDKLYGVLKVAFGDYNFQKIERQRVSFLKQGITNKDMYEALYYWYIVKNKSTEKANGGIGIIPYIVEDSIEYFKEIEKSSQKINPDTFKMDSKIVDVDFSKEKKVETEDERKNRIASIHGWNLSFTNPELFKDLE